MNIFKPVSIGASILLVSIMSFADLPQNSKPLYRYAEVAIHNVKSFTYETKLLPVGSPSEALPGNLVQTPELITTLQIKLSVEGNVCGADPKTIGTYITRVDRKPLYGLIIGREVTDRTSFCLQYSKETELDLTIVDTQFVHSDSAPINKTLALFQMKGFRNGGGERELKLVQNGSDYKVFLESRGAELDEEELPPLP